MASVTGPVIIEENVGQRILRTALWNGDSRGSRVPVLMFNGIGMNLEVMDGIARRLADRPVMMFDVPGIGGSPDPWMPYTAWSVARWGAVLTRRYGFDTVDVIGYSWGGAIAQQFAMQYRKRIRKLVCAAIGPGFPVIPGRPAALSSLVDPGWMKSLIGDPRRAVFTGLTAPDQESLTPDFLQSLQLPGKRGYLFQLSALTGWHSTLGLPFLDTPTLIVMGADDPIVPLMNGRILKALIPGSRLEVIDNAGHLFMFSHQKAFLALLHAFLGSDKQAQRRAA